MKTEAKEAMKEAIQKQIGHEWLTGSDSTENIAAEWIKAGFTADQAEEWWAADCFDAERTAQLRDAGLAPDCVSDDCPQLLGYSWGYAYCDLKISIDDVLAECADD